MSKYKIFCKSCNYEIGKSDSPKIETEPKCPECDSTVISVVENHEVEITPIEFDLVIFNKRTGISKTAGFMLPKETIEKHGKNLIEMRKIMAGEMAKSLHQIVKDDGLLVELLKKQEGGSINEI